MIISMIEAKQGTASVSNLMRMLYRNYRVIKQLEFCNIACVDKKDYYEIVCRRKDVESCPRWAGLKEVPVVVKVKLQHRSIVEIYLIENIQTEKI